MRTTTGIWGRLVLAGVALAVAGGASRAWAGAAEGKAVFEKSCKMCHSIAGDGGKMAATGGPLDGVGGKRDDAWLKAYIADPKSKKPDSKMPKVKVSDQDLSDVAAFLATLK